MANREQRGFRPADNIELAKNMFDVFADGARLCAENNTDIVVALAL